MNEIGASLLSKYESFILSCLCTKLSDSQVMDSSPVFYLATHLRKSWARSISWSSCGHFPPRQLWAISSGYWHLPGCFPSSSFLPQWLHGPGSAPRVAAPVVAGWGPCFSRNCRWAESTSSFASTRTYSGKPIMYSSPTCNASIQNTLTIQQSTVWIK